MVVRLLGKADTVLVELDLKTVACFGLCVCVITRCNCLKEHDAIDFPMPMQLLGAKWCANTGLVAHYWNRAAVFMHIICT